MNQMIGLKPRTIQFLITAALFCCAFSRKIEAVSPSPDGGYPGFNTAEGQNALLQLTTGVANTAVGWFSLESITTGNANTGVGAGTLVLDTADNNTAIGAGALLSNTIGERNTATGAFALLSNTEGSLNTAVGGQALFSNTTGNANNAFGVQALSNSTSGSFNNAFGRSALLSNATGFGNNAFGGGALSNLVSGDYNTAIGDVAGNALTNGGGNVYIGRFVIGQDTEDDHTYIRNINTTTVSGGGADTVTVDLTTGLLGHLSSSRRYKENIKPMKNASQTLYRLQPVIYHYKKEIDPGQSIDYGLVAEDVAKVDPNLAIRNRDGQIESVRYHAINAMLLNEFLKEHAKVQKLEATVERQQKKFDSQLAQQEKRIESLTTGLQQVNARIQMSKTEPQVVVNNP